MQREYIPPRKAIHILIIVEPFTVYNLVNEHNKGFGTLKEASTQNRMNKCSHANYCVKFHSNGQIIGFRPQTQKLHSRYMSTLILRV